ncbi:putative reverse transcriptase domain-containing protein [Tanacetum coccineum]
MTHIPLRPNLGVLQIGIKSHGYREPDFVMSDSEDSMVTYTDVYSPFEDLSDIGSPGVISRYTQSLCYEPEQAPPSPDYVPGPEHADDEIVVEDQPYAEDASPTAQSPDYVPESDPEADPEEDDDEDPEEDPVDYPADGGDDGDDEDEPSEEDEDDDVDIEADEDDEEEEHPASADSVVSAATPPPHPAYRVTARISIPAPVPTPVWSDAEVARLFAISTLPSSPLSPWSSPLPQIPSPSLPLSPPSPVLSPAPPSSPIRSLGYRVAMIRMRAEAASTSHSLPLPPPFILSPTRPDAPSLGIPPPLPISVPTSSPPLLLPSASRREDRPEVTLPPRKRLGIALGPGYEVGESSSAAAARPAGGLRADYGFVATMDREIRRDPEREVGYGITDSWDEIVKTLQGALVSIDTELGRHMTAFETRVRQDTDEVYTRLDDEQSQRQLLAGRLNMLFRDRRAHAYTRHQMETEARLSREAWRRSMDASDLARGEVMSLRTTVLGQMSEIRELHAADRRRQAVTSEMLKAYHRRSTEIIELRTVDCTRQQQLIQTLTVMQSPAKSDTTELPEEAAVMQHECVEATIQEKVARRTMRSHLMFPKESDKIEKYVGGLPDMIPKCEGYVNSGTFADRQTKNKRKPYNNQQPQQYQNKRQNTDMAYAEGTVEKKPYGGSKPLCSKCNYHHDGPCAPKCHKCNKVSHFARDCRSTANANNANHQEGRTGSGQKPAFCFVCGAPGTFKTGNVKS